MKSLSILQTELDSLMEDIHGASYTYGTEVEFREAFPESGTYIIRTEQ